MLPSVSCAELQQMLIWLGVEVHTSLCGFASRQHQHHISRSQHRVPESLIEAYKPLVQTAPRVFPAAAVYGAAVRGTCRRQSPAHGSRILAAIFLAGFWVTGARFGRYTRIAPEAGTDMLGLVRSNEPCVKIVRHGGCPVGW